IEESQQPGAAAAKLARDLESVPHLAGAAHELIASRTFHAVYAKIRAADPHRILRGPGARRIVFGGDQPMTRIERRRDRSPEIHIAQAEHQIARGKDDALHVIDAVESVDPSDELDVAGTPGGIGANRLHVLRNGELSGIVV